MLSGDRTQNRFRDFGADKEMFSSAPRQFHYTPAETCTDMQGSPTTSYDNIYLFENLYRAGRAAARGKRGTASIIKFELDFSRNLWKLHEELENETYHLSGYYHFRIYDPKMRDIASLYFRDRVVQHSLCDNVLRPWFENRLIYDCAACRKDKGTHFAMDRLSGFLRKFYREHGTNGYFLKCDIRKYFDNIDHEILKNKLSKFPDEKVIQMMYDIIDSYHKDSGKGLPLGNQTSQWFALYYLDPLDRLIKERFRIRYYTRYMDDLVLIHEDKNYLKGLLEVLRVFAKDELKLEFNEKTQIFPLSQGVDYLGWHFYLTDTGKVIRRLRTSNKRRFKRRLRSFKKRYYQGELELDDITRSLTSYRGHLSHGHTWKLNKKICAGFVLKRAQMEREDIHEKGEKADDSSPCSHADGGAPAGTSATDGCTGLC